MYEYHTLPNGLKIILSRTPSRVVYSGVYINVGSRDERGSDEGMAHFIEHSIFKGTEHRHAYHIQNRIDGVGGELNAFTTKEETCVYASSLSSHLGRCLELFADILFHSTFPSKEIEREKDVVLEEINAYCDSPAELIFDQYEEQAFAGHPLAHNILGSKRNVRRFTSERLQHFVHENYAPSRMVVAVAGDVRMERLVRLCEKYFGGCERKSSTVDRTQKPVFQPFERVLNRRTHQAHLLIGCEAPDVYHRDKTAFSLLNNLLGGPAMNSRLNVSLREQHGLVYNVESNTFSYQDTGVWSVYFGCEESKVSRCRQLVVHQLEELCSTPLSERTLSMAKKQLIGQILIAGDNFESYAIAMGKAYALTGRHRNVNAICQRIQSITASDLMRVAQDVFSPAQLTTLIYH